MCSVCLGFHSALVSVGAWLRQMFDVFEAGIEEKMKWKRGVQTNLDLYIFLSICRQQDLQRLYQHLQLSNNFHGTLLFYRKMDFFQIFCSLLWMLVTDLWMPWEIINSRSKWFNQEGFHQIFENIKSLFAVTLYLSLWTEIKSCPPFPS